MRTNFFMTRQEALRYAKLDAIRYCFKYRPKVVRSTIVTVQGDSIHGWTTVLK
jgi:hypothetical protein